ncbi:MAG: helix-turn-helix domain-containing protein [Candidatus Geothermarchaeales archaeon]
MSEEEVMERMMKAQELSNRGMTLREIAKEMHLSPSTVWKYLNYDRWKEKQRRRKEKGRTMEILMELWEEGKLISDYDFRCHICGKLIRKGEPVVKIAVHPECLRREESL